MKSIDEVVSVIWITWIWVLDRWYDRKEHIMKPLLKRWLKFVIRVNNTRNVIRVKNWVKHNIKALADLIKTRSRIIEFEYKEKDKKIKIKWRVGFEKIKIPWIEEELSLCVLKKQNWYLGMMLITNMEVENNEDVIKVFSKYSCRWWVEDTYKYLKQEFWLEEIMLKKYKSLQNMMIFILASMNFVSTLRKTEERWFCKEVMRVANVLNWNRLKYIEHCIIEWIRKLLRLSVEWIRDFIKKIRTRYSPVSNQLTLLWNKYCPFEKMGKL
jgi:hypothetical protein